MPNTQSTSSVSVVLCTFDGAAYLEQQLDSIANQILLPLELIACDDGSTDSTMDILHSFKSRAPFPVRISQNSVNLGSTRNFDQAMQRASGKFLALCDQDDIWKPEKLATLVPLLESDTGLGGVFSDAAVVDSGASSGTALQGKTLWSMHGFSRRKQKAFATRAGAIGLLLRADVVTGATLLVRASLRPLWQPIPKSWVHDGWLVWMLTVHTGLKPVAAPLMSYRRHGAQQLGVGSDQTLAERAKAIRQAERARYARVADQFRDLLERLRISGEDHALEGQLQGKINLLQRRAELPHGLVSRVLAILAAAHDYRLYARGWRSMRKDIFLA